MNGNDRRDKHMDKIPIIPEVRSPEDVIRIDDLM